MADRYWVGGTATWDNTAGTKWATTSGGAGGASVPFTGDDVYFDAASGAVTVTTGATVYARSLSFAGFTGTFAGANALVVTGSLTLGASMTRTYTGPITLNSTLTTNTVTSNGIALANQLQFTGGGKWTLQDALSNPTGYTFLTSGTVDLNDQQWATLNFESNNNNVRAVNFGTQGMTLVGVNQGVYIVPDLTNAINDLDFTGFSGRLIGGNRAVYGSLTLGAGMTVDATTGVTLFGATSGPKTITSNGVTFDGPVAFNGVGGSWQLADDFILGASRSLTLTNGTFDANGSDVTLGSFLLGAGTKTLTLGSGVWTVAGSGTAWNANTNVANLTVSPSTGIINMTSASAKTFAGGAKAWPTLNQGGSGALTIQQSNSFANITNTVQPSTITLTSGTTQTVGAFGVSGTAGNLITLNTSTPGSQATLSDSTGTNEVSFVSIQDINATGGANWNAFLEAGNVDAGNNVGWDFFPAIRRVFREVFRPIFRPVF
jgi:hypothetical protein